ncbi:AAA family ATPase [Sphingobacterium athyrii]|uniref:Kinase n=1 Tax=Sphingobacterium athyrii TaxID=2152717 RepID=A0A363NUD0_9SPHI|nr:AAA family ATPase [Sphingobacterium athyrii]PUV24394.1 hypothetical protein DCO56_13700 [Sphingobacterium athyrii]
MSKLIILAGLPGTGKTTLARRLSKELKYFYLRVDCIESPFLLRNAKAGQEGEGYEALINLAYENLNLGHNVIIDTVNPLHISRKMFNQLAERTKAETIQFELKIKDHILHKSRVENRKPDIDGLKVPSWQDVMQREYHEWDKNQDGENYEIWTDDSESAYIECLNIIG